MANLSPSKAALLLRDTYNLYAKMLAAENITVVFDEAINAPAKFDILNRILYISPVHAAQADLVPGLTIHEVGHALFSHLTEDEAKRIKKITKLLNILDDGYQERMMCKHFPGGKKHLQKVFDHFFLNGGHSYDTGDKIIDIVNILNFNCKGFKYGHFKKYPSYVLPEDLELLRQGEQLNKHSMMERWAFSKTLGAAIRKYGILNEDGEDFDFKEGKGKKKDKSDQDDEGGDEGQATVPGDGAGGDVPDDIDDLLDDDKLIDHHKEFQQKMNGNATYELIGGDELGRVADIVDLFNKDSDGPKMTIEALGQTPNFEIAELQRKQFIEAKRIANQIFTKFNMKVQAKNFANAAYKQTGMLDPERAALYQVYDDVFMKQSIESNQINHAYTVVLDWSGSMSSSVWALMLRILELVFFAQSTGIEIEVWLYTSGYKHKIEGVHRKVALCPTKLIKVLNTKTCNSKELDERMKLFWLLASKRWSKLQTPNEKTLNTFFYGFSLSGTAIFEGLLWGHHVLSRMKADRKTCFLLTDGQDVMDFEAVVQPSTQTVSHVDDVGNVYVNGLKLSSLYPQHQEPRLQAAHAAADMYRSIGQKTVGIAWNCLGPGVREYADAMVYSKSSEVVEPANKVADYIYSSNLFVDEIVKNLL